MFYLVSFLTLLISLLVYMMDPAPVQQRQDLDTRSAEAYIVGFVNQHQAARDYMNQWLNRIDYDNGNIQEIAGDANALSTRDPNAKVLALPANMDDFVSMQGSASKFTLERATGINGYDANGHPIPDANGYLSFQNLPDQKVGSYLSALVCLNSAGELTPCYRDRCKDASDVLTNTASCGVPCDAGSGYNRVGSRFCGGVVPYVVTYSDNTNDPAWWSGKGQTRPLRHEMWRHALANRTHASYHCGVISDANSVDDNGNTIENHYTKLGLGKIKLDPGQPANNNADQSRYCINNGNRCMTLLPAGMQAFLDGVVTNAGDLSGILFCMTELKDPYGVIAAPDSHYDGIDNQGVGAITRDDISGHQWFNWLGKSFDLSGFGRWDMVTTNGNIVESRGFRVTDAVHGIVTPLEHTINDFTLTVVMSIPFAENVEGWLIGSQNDVPGAGQPKSGFGLYKTADNYVIFYPTTSGSYEEPTSTPASIVGTHSWTIVRSSGNMSLFLDGKRINFHGVSSLDGNGTTIGGVGAKNIVLGKLENTIIYDIKYYERVLEDDEIERTFKVDSQRYGI